MRHAISESMVCAVSKKGGTCGTTGKDMGKVNFGHVKERWSWVGIRPGLCLRKVTWQSQVKHGGKRD